MAVVMSVVIPCSMLVRIPQADAKLSTAQSQLLKGMFSIANSTAAKTSETALDTALYSANTETLLKIGLSTYGSEMSSSQRSLVELGILIDAPANRSLLAPSRAGKRFSAPQKAALMRLVATAADNIGIAQQVREGKQLLGSPATLAADVQAQERASSSGAATAPSTGDGALDRLEASIVRAGRGSAATSVAKRVTSWLQGSVLNAYVNTMSPLQAASFVPVDTRNENTSVRIAHTGFPPGTPPTPVNAQEQANEELLTVVAGLAADHLSDKLQTHILEGLTGASFYGNFSVALLQLQGLSRASAEAAFKAFGSDLVGSVGADGIPTGVLATFGEASLPETAALLAGASAELGTALIGGIVAGTELTEACFNIYYSKHPLGLEIVPSANVQMTAGQPAAFVVKGLGPNLSVLGLEPAATVNMVPNGGPCPAQICTTTVAGPDGVTATMVGASGVGIVMTSVPVTVLPGPLKFFGLAPTTVTIPLGADTNFAVFGTDAWDNPIDPGAVESATTFSISPGSPDGWCVANTCGATTPGTYTVTATSGAFSQSATLTVTATATGPLDHLTLSPASASITAGGSETYTVEGYDAANDDLGPVTDATLSISPDGSCSGYTCTPASDGDHTVTATDGAAQGTATLNVTTSDAAPCVFSNSGPPDCQSTDPLVTDEATTQGASGCTLSDNIDWGDGSPVQTVEFTGSAPLETFPIAEYTYSTPGTYTITASAPVGISGPCEGGVGSGDNYQFTLLSSGRSG